MAGRTELRVLRVRTGRYPSNRNPSPVEAVQKLGGHWAGPGRASNEEPDVVQGSRRQGVDHGPRARATGTSWYRAIDPSLRVVETLSLDKGATRLGICVGSVYGLIRTGLLPVIPLMSSATWEIPAAALEAGPAKAGVREIVNRRPKYYKRFQEDKTLKLPGF